MALVAALVAPADGTPSLLGGLHDVSDGGIGLALAEMAVASNVGFAVPAGHLAGHSMLFGEGPSRVLLSVAPAQVALVLAAADADGVPISQLGVAGGSRLVVEGLVDVDLVEAVSAWRSALPRALGLDAPIGT